MQRFREGFFITVIFTPIAAALFSWVLAPVVEHNYVDAHCGGFNSCANSQALLTLELAFLFSVVAISLARYYKIFKGKPLDFALGFFYLIAAPVINYMVNDYIVTTFNLWGNARGAFNHTYIPVAILVNLVVLFAIAFSGRKAVGKEKKAY